MATKNTSLICNKFGGIRRINATFSSLLITASDIQNIELFNTGINKNVGIRTAKEKISIWDLIPSDDRIINMFENVQKHTSAFAKS